MNSKDIEPPIWRRLQVPTDITLPRLHDTLQVAMGWTDSHLHSFQIGDKEYSNSDELDELNVLAEKGRKLDSLLGDALRDFDYLYDFGDSWQHRSVVESIAAAQPHWIYPLCVGGARACPPEVKDNIETPTLPLSRWITPSQEFLEIYHSNEDLYRACVSTTFCDANYALSTLTEDLKSWEDVMKDLWELGVQSHASGYFDFDNDDQSERWFTARHRPLETLLFWILGAFTDGVKALFTGEVESSPPLFYFLDPGYVSAESQQWSPVVYLPVLLA